MNLAADTATAIDWARIRGDFPLLERRVHGKPLIYLDSANTGQKPEPVIAAVDDFYRRHNANVSRAVHALGTEATEAYEGARAKLAKFLNVRADELVLCSGTTFALLSLGLSLLLSVLAWFVVTSSVLRDQRASALAATSIDASHLDARLGVGGSSMTSVLDELPRTQASAAIAEVDERWYASAPTLGPGVLPQELVDLVGNRQAATQRLVDWRYLCSHKAKRPGCPPNSARSASARASAAAHDSPSGVP